MFLFISTLFKHRIVKFHVGALCMREFLVTRGLSLVVASHIALAKLRRGHTSFMTSRKENLDVVTVSLAVLYYSSCLMCLTLLCRETAQNVWF